MSSDSRPSFRTYLKDKIKTGIKPNITSSIRQSFISNDTYHNVREKYHNFTDIAKDRTGINKIMNKTKELLPGVFRSNNNETSRKGFYDSLFSPQTEDDVYIKVAIMCLWIIAILCIIPTIITLFIPSRNKQTKKTGVKMIFFHIFLCEFFYLIYILLSMINVALNFQLNAVLCDIANYGMYITIPVMHFALLFLSIERITTLCKSAMALAKIFTQAYVVQAILFLIWFICIAIITTIMLVKKQFSFRSIVGKAKDIAPPIFHDIGKKFVSPYQCSIDGRLSSLFKILFIILFIILIVLIVKSIIVSIFYNFFTPKCCTSKGKKSKSTDHHITLLYIIFVLLNLFFSYPFYFISMAHSILTHFSSTKDTFTMKLKISFTLRLASIILQCVAFSIFENNSWSLLSGLLYRGTCKKIPALNNGAVYTKKPTKPKPHVNADSDDNEDVAADEGENEDVSPDKTEDEDSDEVFTAKPVNTKTSERKVEITTDEDDSDDETEELQKKKTTMEKKDVTDSQRQKRDENVPTKKVTSKHSNSNGISKQIPNGKSTSQRISSAPTNLKTSKSNADQNRTKHQSVQLSSSSDEISNASVDSDDEVKPCTNVKTKQPAATVSTLNEQKRTTTVLPNEHRSHHQHRTKRSQVSRPETTTSSHHHHIKRTKKRRSANNYSEKSKHDRLSKILDNSDEV